MRLAYIDHNIKSDEFLSLGQQKDREQEVERLAVGLRIRGIDLKLARTPREFKENHGSLDSFDGLIIHPGRTHKKRIFEIKENHPNLPLILITNVAKDYTENDIPVFNYESADKIIEYFEKRKR